MKLSRRAKRMQRHYRRMHKAGGLNLVSLMDIFTILVFFLMVNSSDVKVLQQDKNVSLPVSAAEKQPKDNIVITVSDKHILVQGRPVAELQKLTSDHDTIHGLKVELDYQASKKVKSENDFIGHAATLVADKSVPYKVLKKVMATCTEAEFTQISLAVSRKSDGKGA